MEEAFGKIKGSLRKAEAHTRAALVEAMGRALPAVNGHGARISSTAAVTVRWLNLYD